MTQANTFGQHPSPIQKLIVFRALPGLGDALCFLPALRALRSTFPNAELSVAGLPSQRAFARRFSAYFDHWIGFPGWPGLPDQQADHATVNAFIETVVNGKYDVALQMHGSGRVSNEVVRSFGARRSAGCTIEGAAGLDFAIDFDESENEAVRLLRIVEGAAGPASEPPTAVPFPLDERDCREAAALLDAHGLAGGGYVCVHPGAKQPGRRWAPELFAKAASVVGARFPVIVTGVAEEASLANEVAAAAGQHAVSVAGRTTLGGLAALMQGARLVLTNDSGPSHLAAALGTPSITTFVATSPARWAPLDRAAHRAIDGRASERVLPEVLAACRELLAEGDGHVE